MGYRRFSFVYVVCFLVAAVGIFTGGRAAIGAEVNNVVNPGFESGKTPWQFYTNGTGSFVVTSPAYEGTGAARITTTTGGTNIQFYQFNVPLKPNTDYELSFAAYSSTGHDMRISLHQHVSPYANYGLNRQVVNLGTSWGTHTIGFTTTAFSAPVNDARLQFWLATNAAAGDQYWIDNVVLVVLNEETALAPVQKTGQTLCYDKDYNEVNCAGTGQDGEYQKGVSYDPRFTDNGDGTVTDNLTGLIWLKNAGCAGGMSWEEALAYCNNLASGICGLADGSVAGDWRLPNIKEIQSLIDFGSKEPALLSGHPFTDVVIWFYWSSSTFAFSTYYTWGVYMGTGHVGPYDKLNTAYYVWPVRGGQ